MTHAKHLEPEARSRSTEIAAVAGLIAVLFAGSTILTPLYVMYKDAFGFSQITLTLTYAVYVVGNLGALLIFGRISDRVGRRPVALAAVGVAMASALIFLFAQNVVELNVARILSGFGIGIGAGAGTAWIAEMFQGQDKSRATLIAVATNFVGLGLGALIAGALADFAPAPLHTVFALYLAALAIVAAIVWRVRETVTTSVQSGSLSLTPRVSVPAEIRSRFVAPAIAGFGTMSIVGYYACLTPSILSQTLGISDHLAAGALFFELALAATLTTILGSALSSRAAMLSALALMIPTVASIALAQATASLSIMIGATALCGVAGALGYRGALQVVNQIAPSDKRSEVVSAFFSCCFSGNALPVVGIGVLSTWYGATVANIAFAALISLFSLVALSFAYSYGR